MLIWIILYILPEFKVFFCFPFSSHEELLALDGLYCNMWHQQQVKHEDGEDSGAGSSTEETKKEG